MLISEWRAARGGGAGVKVLEFGSTVCLSDQHRKAVWSFVRSLMFAFLALYPSEDKRSFSILFSSKTHTSSSHLSPAETRDYLVGFTTTLGLSLSFSHKHTRSHT
ncbi:hypothetical protein ATANTOWER_025772 [Ataeniobius toweri]|uniref:Uncharacterized protein n=1 Tax=Ataeniobius toweri TaxID=208326 RepID=A0ABU7ACM5_9TELE|nr:hypothetical protein [Ataeniobius toweri]